MSKKGQTFLCHVQKDGERLLISSDGILEILLSGAVSGHIESENTRRGQTQWTLMFIHMKSSSKEIHPGTDFSAQTGDL